MEKPYFKIGIFLLMACLKAFALTIEPRLPRIGERVLISGEGYKPSEDIAINFEKKIFKAKASLSGTFSTTFIIQSQPGGQKTITAKSKSKSEAISFWIRPVMRAYPLRGSRETRVFIDGWGYPSREKVQVGMGFNSCVTFVDVEKGGTFSSSFIIGNFPYGSNTFFTLDRVTFRDERMAFFMEPDLKVIPQSGKVDSIITLSGTGYKVPVRYELGEWVRIDFGNYVSIACVRSDKFGSFEIPFKVPIEPSGKVSIQANGLFSSITSKVSFEIFPRIRQFPQSAEPLRPMKIEGDGFSKYETITITLEKRREGTKTLVQREEFLTSENGDFSLDFLVDTQPKGIKRVTIKGKLGFYEKRDLEIKPCIEVIEADRKAGTLTIKGFGFLPYEDVTLGFGGPRCIGKVSIDKEGSFLKTFIVNGIQEKEEIIASSTKSNEVIIVQIEVEAK